MTGPVVNFCGVEGCGSYGSHSVGPPKHKEGRIYFCADHYAASRYGVERAARQFSEACDGIEKGADND
jgi:hypothetical protein